MTGQGFGDLFDAYPHWPLSPLTAGFWWVMPLIYLSASLPAGGARFK
jgi:hypothetical protein